MPRTTNIKPSQKTRVVVARQLSGYDPRLDRLICEGAKELARTGGVVMVVGTRDEDNTPVNLRVMGTYHRVADSEWGNIKFFKGTDEFDLLAGTFFEGD